MGKERDEIGKIKANEKQLDGIKKKKKREKRNEFHHL